MNKKKRKGAGKLEGVGKRKHLKNEWNKKKRVKIDSNE